MERGWGGREAVMNTIKQVKVVVAAQGCKQIFFSQQNQVLPESCTPTASTSRTHTPNYICFPPRIVLLGRNTIKGCGQSNWSQLSVSVSHLTRCSITESKMFQQRSAAYLLGNKCYLQTGLFEVFFFGLPRCQRKTFFLYRVILLFSFLKHCCQISVSILIQ